MRRWTGGENRWVSMEFRTEGELSARKSVDDGCCCMLRGELGSS